MADREKVFNRIETICNICKENTWRTEFSSDTIYPLLRDVLALLKEKQAVVLCGNCAHGHLVGSGFCECEKDGNAHYHDWFCADGERRGE